MPEEPGAESESGETTFSRTVGAQAARKLQVQRTPLRSIWLGFGVTGVIGWSVAVPTLLGTVIGLWLDRRFPGGHSWTLALLVAGLCIGCFQAWNWVAQEDKAMYVKEEQAKEENDHD